MAVDAAGATVNVGDLALLAGIVRRIESDSGDDYLLITTADGRHAMRVKSEEIRRIAGIPTSTGGVTFAASDRVLGRATAGPGAAEEIPCTQAGRNLLDDADAAAQRTTLGLGSAAQANTSDFAALSHTHPPSNLTSGGASAGAILIYNGTSWVALEPGTTGQILTMGGDGLPEWQTP